MTTLAIPDLHGRFDLLVMAEDYINKNYKDCKLVFLGDYIDRGPQSMQVLDWCMGHPEHTYLKGNHEDMMDQGLSGDATHLDVWLINGGDRCLDSFGDYDLQPYVDWIKKLPVYHRDEHRSYVHGYAPASVKFKNVDPATFLWGRFSDNHDYTDVTNRHIVHGHTPVKEPELKKNRTNLDCGAVWSNKLCIGVFDGVGGPTKLIWVSKSPWGMGEDGVWEEQL